MLMSFSINIEILCLFFGTRCEPFKKKLYSVDNRFFQNDIILEVKFC